MSTQLARGSLKIFAFIGVLGAVLATRVVLSSRAELNEGLALKDAADLDAAVVHLRRAARWYAPGNPYSSRALDELAAIARQSETEGNIDNALEAWRAIRGSIMATRSFYTPHGAHLAQANGHIASLMAALPAPAMDAGKTRADLTREHKALLDAAQGPSMGWTMILLVGFVVWLSATFALAWRGFDPDSRVVWPEAKRWGLLVIAGFSLFALGLALA